MSLLETLLPGDLTLSDLDERLNVFRRNQHYLYIFVLLCLGVYLFIGKMPPKIKIYNEKMAVLNGYKRVLKEKEKEVLQRENIELELEKLQTKLKDSNRWFFSEEAFNEFSINILPKLVDGIDNRILSVHYNKPQPFENKMILYPTDVTFKGGYTGLMHFMNDLESFSKVVKIDTLNVTRKGVNPVVLTVKLRFDAYGIQP